MCPPHIDPMTIVQDSDLPPSECCRSGKTALCMPPQRAGSGRPYQETGRSGGEPPLRLLTGQKA